MKVLLIAVLSATLLMACSEPPKEEKPSKPRPVKVMTVGVEQDSIVREFTGKVLATVKAELLFEVKGKLINSPYALAPTNRSYFSTPA